MHAWFDAIKARPWLGLTLSACAGILIGLALLAWWICDDARTSIEIVNSGDGLTIAINDDRHHVLIASGTNGSAFANALDDLSNPLTGALDLVLLDPASSEDVKDRARSLNAGSTFELPGEKLPATVNISDEMTLVHSETESGIWTVKIQTIAGTILISPDPDQVDGSSSLIIQPSGELPAVIPSGITWIAASDSGETDQPNLVTLTNDARLSITIEDSAFHLDGPHD